MAGLLSRYFGFTERSTTLATEVRAGFTTFTAIKLLLGRGAQLGWMVYLACAAFIVYFCMPLIEGTVK